MIAGRSPNNDEGQAIITLGFTRAEIERMIGGDGARLDLSRFARPGDMVPNVVLYLTGAEDEAGLIAGQAGRIDDHTAIFDSRTSPHMEDLS
jgi:hypothetical protein